MINLALTDEQFGYLARAVQRDCDDHGTMLECGVEEIGLQREFGFAEDMARVLDRVFQEQVVPF